MLRGEAAYAALGTAEEPGTDPAHPDAARRGAAVREVAYGDPLGDVLPDDARRPPALVGGFHGSWATWPTLRAARGCRCRGLRAARLRRWAPGVVLAVDGRARSRWTQRIVDYLAGQSAGRCGPCRNGLPALAAARARALDDGAGGRPGRPSSPGWSSGRGACAHPTARSGWSARCWRRTPTRSPRTPPAAARGRRTSYAGAERRREPGCGSTGPAARPAGCATSCCPSWSTLDEWGYPVVRGEVTDELVADARAAVRVPAARAAAGLALSRPGRHTIVTAWTSA